MLDDLTQPEAGCLSCSALEAATTLAGGHLQYNRSQVIGAGPVTDRKQFPVVL
jgi:hypothetical protein